MKRLRFSSIVLCALAIASVAAATTPTYSPPAGRLVPAATATNVTRAPKRCEPCTLQCPVGFRILQNGHCECACLTLPQERTPEEGPPGPIW